MLKSLIDFSLKNKFIVLLATIGLVLGGVGTIPWHSPAAEEFLAGKSLSEAVVAQAAQIALQGAKPMEQNAYKIPLTQALVRRALTKLGA